MRGPAVELIGSIPAGPVDQEGDDVRFLGLEGGTIKDGMMGKAHEWLVANEAELRSAAPEGTEYLGVYAPVFTSEKNPGDVSFVYAVDSYGALDRQAASSIGSTKPRSKRLAGTSDLLSIMPRRNLLSRTRRRRRNERTWQTSLTVLVLVATISVRKPPTATA
jgi:hypothetical protein